MASLKQKRNKWYAQFYIDGKQRRVATGFDVIPADGSKPAISRRRAQQAAELLERKEKGELTGTEAAAAFRALAAMVDDTPVLTVREYLTAYNPSGKEQNQSNARRAVRLFLDFLTVSKADGFSLSDVKPRHCAEFLGAMLQDVKIGTVRNYKQQLSTAFTRALRDELITSNPFALLRMDEIERQYSPETRGKDKVTREPFTAEEMRVILFDLPQPWRDLAAVSFYTGGQRIGDCTLLTWGQVDFERGQVSFCTQKTAKRITHPLRDELRRRLEARRATAPAELSAYVFPELARMAERARGSVSTEFTTLLRSHGIIHESAPSKLEGKRRAMRSKTFHCIRHTVVSMLRGSNQVSADVCRAVVGHDSETVERAYFTAPAEDVNRAFDVLDAYIFAPTATPSTPNHTTP